MSAKSEKLRVIAGASDVVSDYLSDLRDKDEDSMYECRIKSLEKAGGAFS